MSVFDVDPPIIDKKHLIKWLKINFSFLRNKLLKIKQLDSERDINFILSINNKKKYPQPRRYNTTRKRETVRRTLILTLIGAREFHVQPNQKIKILSFNNKIL